MADGHSLEAKQKEKSYRQPRKCCIYDGRLLKLDKKDIDNLKKNCTILTGEGGFGKVYKSELINVVYQLKVKHKYHNYI